jgi:vitamin B12 transporter
LRFDRIRTDFGFAADRATSSYGYYATIPAFGFFANRNLHRKKAWVTTSASNNRCSTTGFGSVRPTMTSPTSSRSMTPSQPTSTLGAQKRTGRKVSPRWRLRLRTDYTHTVAIDADTGLELLRRPKDNTSLTRVWNPIDPWTLSATVLRVSSWTDTDRFGLTTRLTAPGYTVVNVVTNYNVNQHVTVFGRIDNLFDEHYQDPTGFLRPGIGAFIGLRLTN